MKGTQDGWADDILSCARATGAAAPSGDWNDSAIAEAVASYDAFARDELLPANQEGDRAGCRLERGRVRVPEALERAWTGYVGRGLHLAGLPESAGGLAAPPAVLAAGTELMAGSNHGFQMLVGLLPGVARVIVDGLPTERADDILAGFAAGNGLATMAITEPEAGSDLTRIATRGEQQGDSWRITGNKIFISGGDQSLTPNILHLVLARTGGRDDRPELSLFAVPSSGEAGRNGVSVRRIESKLGLHASPTCDMGFDGARGEIVGTRGEGLARMFRLMNATRLDVALQAVGHAARVTGLARIWAGERRQGRDDRRRPVALAAHGDIRRMLADMDATTLGLRAMCHLALACPDPGLLDFLTPVCKAYCSDEGMRVVDMGMQVHGGYGYLNDYGIGQHWRDCRVTRIYEGANGIQAMTLADRLLRKRDGALADAFADTVVRLAREGSSTTHSAAGEVIAHWRNARAALVRSNDRGAAAYAFLNLTGLTWFVAAWSRLEAAAASSADPARIAGLARFAAETAEPRARWLAGEVARLARPGAVPETT